MDEAQRRNHEHIDDRELYGEFQSRAPSLTREAAAQAIAPFKSVAAVAQGPAQSTAVAPEPWFLPQRISILQTTVL